MGTEQWWSALPEVHSIAQNSKETGSIRSINPAETDGSSTAGRATAKR
jgi:hypothetical protein